MGILIDSRTRVLIQGITGREGRRSAALMAEYGTRIIAGVTPGKAGESVGGIPVFDSVEEALQKAGHADASVIFAPGVSVREAACEALEAGIQLIVIVPDRVPIHDFLYVMAFAKERGAKLLGPNCIGICTAGEALIGMIGGSAETARSLFAPGTVGIVSRSGGLASSAAHYISKAGLGVTSVVHVGGDSIVGLRMSDILVMFDRDPATKAICLLGEIGSSQEEAAARTIVNGSGKKPVVAFLCGASAQPGVRYSHAAAIVNGGRGSYESKVSNLVAAGVHVVDSLSHLATAVREVLK